jgi:hypothetical protein
VPKSDPERVLCFFKAMKLLSHHPILLPFSELTMADLLPHLHYLALNDYDTIITHNPTGEYGHPQHKQLHAYIAEKFNGNIYCFGFGKGNVVVHLNPVEQRRKVAALLCYDNFSPVDGGLCKWDALIRQYHVDLDHEFYTRFAVKCKRTVPTDGRPDAKRITRHEVTAARAGHPSGRTSLYQLPGNSSRTPLCIHASNSGAAFSPAAPHIQRIMKRSCSDNSA